MAPKQPAVSTLEQRMPHGAVPPDFLDTPHQWRRFSECWSTFLLVIAAGADVVGSLSGGTVTLSMKMVAPGIMVMAVIYFMGAVGGAHLNPAVTLAFAVRPPIRPATLLAQESAYPLRVAVVFPSEPAGTARQRPACRAAPAPSACPCLTCPDSLKPPCCRTRRHWSWR